MLKAQTPGNKAAYISAIFGLYHGTRTYLERQHTRGNSRPWTNKWYRTRL